MAPHQPLVDRLYEEMKGAHQGGRILASRRRTATGCTGPRTRPAASIANGGASPSRGGDRRAAARRARAGRGQGIFPARRVRDHQRRHACSPMRSTTAARSGSRSGSRTSTTGEHLPEVDPGHAVRHRLDRRRQRRSSTASPTSSGAPTMRGFHRLGTPVADDVELYHEADEGFASRSRRPATAQWIVIAHRRPCHQRGPICCPPNDPLAEPILVAPRQTGPRI